MALSHMLVRRGSIVIVLIVVAAAGSVGWGHASSSCEVHYPSDAAVGWECRVVREGETLEGLFGQRWVDVARFNRIDRRHVYAGVGIKVPRSAALLDGFTPLPRFYPPARSVPKFILVDLSEQFLGAYERGRLTLSFPITSGQPGSETPNGEFRLTVAHRLHESTLYSLEGRDVPYPMTYALFFHINAEGESYWMHGRDLPGRPDSHGCIGLYDEAMQREHYGLPAEPILDDARRLYDWVTGDRPDDGTLLRITDGPRVLIRGRAPVPVSSRRGNPDEARPLPCPGP